MVTSSAPAAAGFTRALTLVVVALLANDATSAAQTRRAPSDQEVLEQLERDWDAAFQRKDTQFIAGILADEFTVTYGDGRRGDKAAELKATAEFNQQIDASEVGDFIVKVYGDTAVVWFEKRMVGPSQGRTIEITYRFMDVFVLRDGRWQCVASQSTKVV